MTLSSFPAGQVHAVAVQELVLLDRLFLLRVLLGRLLPGRLAAGDGQTAAAEQLIEQRESGCAALGAVVGLVVILAEHAAHLIAEHVQVILGNAHLLDHLVDLGNSKALGTFQAVALVEGIAILYSRYKNNCNIFLALDAHFRLHDLSLLFRVFASERSIAHLYGKRKNKL